jgi:hypothetical protein
MPSKIAHEWGIVARKGISDVRIFVVGAVHVGGATAIADQDPLAQRRAALSISLDDQLYAKRLSEYLNAQVAHGGYWQVSWAEPDPFDQKATEMVMRWRDRDWDIHLRIFVEGKLPEIAAMDMKDFAGDAELAWQETRDTMKGWLGVGQGQTIMAAKGEGRSMPHIRGPGIFGS